MQRRAGVSALFVIGLGMLWAAGFAPSLAAVAGEGVSSLVVPVLSGATVAALGIAQCCGAALERGSKLAFAAAVALAGCAAVGFWPAVSGGLVYAQPILNGLLFFCWLVAFLRFRDGIADCAVPLGFLLGSALALVFAGPLSAGAPTRMAFLGASCAVFLVLGFACADEGDGEGATVSNAEAVRRRPSVRSVLLRYAALAAGSVALAFVFGVMTDLHGWMASEQAACTIQIANGIVAALMAVVFALYRRPFRVDAALTVTLPLFALALLSGPAEAGDVSFSRLAIMVGYLLFFITSWVLVRRDAPPFRTYSIPVLAWTVGTLLAFSQIGRLVAGAAIGSGILTSEVLSAISLGLFWVLALIAIAAYWLARSWAVERDLAMLEAREDTGGAGEGANDMGERIASGEDTGASRDEESEASNDEDSALGELGGGKDMIRHMERRAQGEPLAEAEVIRKPGIVFVDTMSHQAKRLATQIGLSARELEVLEEFARGRSAASIAEKLFISTNTVKTHLRRIYEKAGIHSRRELLDMMEEA